MEEYLNYVTDPANRVWVVMIVNGLIAGWLAGLLLGGGGLIRNLLVGIIGAVVGGWLFNAGYLPIKDYYDFDTLTFTYGYGNQLVASTIGAMLVVLVARFLGGR
jgi:uncharacterized membrane protein YeaQ/YmgE (transglycosylase-associated protein family)